MSDYDTIEGVTITHHPAEDGKSGEYRARIEGSDTVGRLTWKARDGARLVDHTLVPREIGGRGVAAQLVDAVVIDARREGFRIIPQCSYVARKFAENPQWADLRA